MDKLFQNRKHIASNGILGKYQRKRKQRNYFSNIHSVVIIWLKNCTEMCEQHKNGRRCDIHSTIFKEKNFASSVSDELHGKSYFQQQTSQFNMNKPV